VTGPSTKLKSGPVAVLLAQALERPLALPALEHLELERRVCRAWVANSGERVGHERD
jgi:hypothetical protein